jgi:hypothetical protein
MDNTTLVQTLAFPPATDPSRQAWQMGAAPYYGAQSSYQAAAMPQAQPAYGYAYPQAATGNPYGYGNYYYPSTYAQGTAGHSGQQAYQNQVNVDRGVVRTEKRGVFIKDLPYEATKEDLQQLLSTVATPVSLDFPYDHKTNKSRGYATAQFASAYEADQVVRQIDGTKMGKRTIKVRFDKETHVVQGS